jgi:hypothetical protein
MATDEPLMASLIRYLTFMVLQPMAHKEVSESTDWHRMRRLRPRRPSATDCDRGGRVRPIATDCD